MDEVDGVVGAGLMTAVVSDAPGEANPGFSILHGNHIDRAVEVIDVSEHHPRRIPSKKWRELIRKVWEADPLLCPNCGREMRIVALINERDVIERILRHLRLWEPSGRVVTARDPPVEEFIKIIIDPWLDDDPFPEYDDEPVMMAAGD